MTNTVGIITESITTDALWGTIGTIMPFVVTVTLFALGFYLVRKQLRKVSKAKAGM